MTNISGIANELQFVKSLDGRCVAQLNPLLKELIYTLFFMVNDNDIVECWKNRYDQKSDIFIRVNGVMKGISIKKGSRNSLHVERISDFIHFLIENKVDREIVIQYLKYHYADGSTNGKGIKRLSVEEYKKDNQDKINKINKVFNNENMLKKAIARFVTKGNNSNYYIDAIIYGEVNGFLWITRDDIKKMIMAKKDIPSSAVHFGPLICQPKNRCLNYNSRYEKDRFCVQIKWYSLFDDIIENMNNKFINKK